jgi:hypothetical protein
VFANAIANCAEFTRAVLISTRRAGGGMSTDCGAFVLINAEGWILTAGHVAEALLKLENDKPDYDAYVSAVQAIESDQTLPSWKQKQKLRGLKFDADWMAKVSYWWGADGVSWGTWHRSGLSDLALVKLTNCNFGANQKFAKFGDASLELPQGRSLCKLGFPFHKFDTDFDAANDKFVIKDLQLVRYPLDGMLTRYINVQSADRKQTAKFMEMSTPGLMGQSGGPVFDVNGVVWGIQSHTRHLRLGFSPKLKVKDKNKDRDVTEHQFLNAGEAAYISEIIAFLDKHKIAFEKA